MDKEGLLRLAAAAESLSAHPIARSVTRAVPGFDPTGVTGSREAAGRGVTVEWKGMRIAAGSRALLQEMGVACPQVHSPHTQVYVAAGGAYAGCLLIADAPKPGSAPAIAALRRLGARRIAMLTGDGEESASAAAAAVGIDEYHAAHLPLQKVEWLETLDRSGGGGHTICFIGDGVNDSPAIARAGVGVAMGALGSDAAIEAADVVLMSGDPARLPEAVSIARRTHAIVMQNIVFALGVKFLLLILGALGLATMWQAVFGDVGVMVIAVLNSMRLLRTGSGLLASNEESR
ncbi:MAG: HAD-IC family P-type ATPase [Mailhella sp.]|nr:HAD-IC family P-type ATPase [Mailhella sp.]